MSMTAFELMAKLSLDKSNYDKGLNDAENQGQNAGGKIGNALGNAAKVGLGIATAATGAAAIALGRLATQAVSSYAQYEQLVGGVEKLYQDASQKVVDYADKAYMTSGMSANNYMEIATSFSAALINSLGGDMDKAADMTDLAMRAISDNVNVFGSDMQSVQYAFQGFAKQNYTMLDNLKLGYGGTKNEMNRLIADANEYAASIGQASDMSIESFADIVRAIDLIQQKQGIAGTTAKEAMHTIEGAARATQAAWKNVITAIAGGGDLQKAFDGLTTAIFGDGSEGSGLLANIIPRIQKTMDGIGQFVAKASPYIEKYLPSLFEAILPPLLDSAANLMVSLAKSLPKLIGVILDAIPRIMKTIADAIKKESSVIGGALEVVAKVVSGLFNFIKNNGKLIEGILAGIVAGFMAFKTIMFIQELIPIISGIVTTVTSTVAAMELMGAASAGLTGALGVLTGAVEMLDAVLLANPIGLVIAAIVAAVAAIGGAVYILATEKEVLSDVTEAEDKYNEAVKNTEDALKSYGEAVKSLRDAQKNLAEQEQELGQSGEELYNQVAEGKIRIDELSDAQLDLYNAYTKVKEAQDEANQKALESIAKKQEENAASLELMGTIANETGEWANWGEGVKTAWEQGQITTEQARDLFEKSMAGMSDDAKIAFMENIPTDIKDGMNPNNYETSWQDFRNSWDTLWNLVTGKSEVSFGDIMAKGDASIGGIKFSWGDVGDWLGNQFETGRKNVENAWNTIGDWFSGIWNDIKSAFDFSDAFNWGSDMINNFVDGLKKKWEELKQGVSDTAQIIANFFKHSTPKEGPLADDDIWTKHMMDNFIDGIDDNKNKLKKSITSVADMMAEPMTMNVDGVFSGKNGEYNENIKSGNVYNISFNQPVNSPVQMARKIREEAQYGLLGG